MGLIRINKNEEETCMVFSIPASQLKRDILTKDIETFLKAVADKVKTVEYNIATHICYDKDGNQETELKKVKVRGKRDLRKALSNLLVYDLWITLEYDGCVSMIVYLIGQEEVYVLHSNDDLTYKDALPLPLDTLLYDKEDDELYMSGKETITDIASEHSGDVMVEVYTVNSPDTMHLSTTKEYINRILNCKEIEIKDIMISELEYDDGCSTPFYKDIKLVNRDNILNEVDEYERRRLQKMFDEDAYNISDEETDEEIYCDEEDDDIDVFFGTDGKASEETSKYSYTLSLTDDFLIKDSFLKKNLVVSFLLSYENKEFLLEFSPYIGDFLGKIEISLLVAGCSHNSLKTIKKKLSSLGDIITLSIQDTLLSFSSNKNLIPYWNQTPSLSIEETYDVIYRYDSIRESDS